MTTNANANVTLDPYRGKLESGKLTSTTLVAAGLSGDALQHFNLVPLDPRGPLPHDFLHDARFLS
jgi:hypothetical protein